MKQFETIFKNDTMKNELNFGKEESIGLYRIFCGLSRRCYQNVEVYDDVKSDMEKVYDKVIGWGIKNCDDVRGEKLQNN